MGGIGSGSWYRWDTTPKVNGMRSLNINSMVKQGAIQDGCITQGLWGWRDSETGEQTSSVSYEVDTLNSSPFMRLSYTIKDTQQKCDYKIFLETTTPHYGGKRYWFICPYTGKRAGKLYRPYGADKYGSRKAFRLKYQSQSDCALSRMINKKWRLKNKLGGEDSYYIRPKGMHNKTHERLLNEIWELEEMIDNGLFLKFQSLNAFS